MSKLIAVRLEPDHQNTNACSFYAYFEGGACDLDQVNEAFENEDDRLEGGALSPTEELSDGTEEVPNALTRATGLRRFFVCQAC